ncbi:MAG: DUF547 domain-containing protein [Pseudomonadota bacterium]|nr:DUF547 domain-containing protein [Pseudomonadota bacterium]
MADADGAPLALSQALLVAARTGEPELAPLVARLADVDPATLRGDAPRLAFWINVYNARVKSAVRERAMRGNLRAYRGFFKDVGWVVGGRPTSLHVMEHGLLRVNRPAPYTFWRPLSAADPRLAWAPSRLDARVHFALNCGAVSCPPIRAYAAERLDEQLALATRSYLDGEVVVAGRTVTVPYLCTLYRGDFGPGLLDFVAAHVDPERAAAIRALGATTTRSSGARVRFGPYRWEIGGE